MKRKQTQSLDKIKIDPEQKSKDQNSLPRPPIVVILGHVDHGKTTLLDHIRKIAAKAAPAGSEPRPVAGREAGEITQSIGAYEIEHNGKKITFIDTPGHEAFNKMREHGAGVADLAVLVVAADESIKPQTKESIDVLNKTKTPFVVAINKIDKPGANTNKIINDLTELNVLLEKYGGHIPWQAVSAKTGEGINELLELILLAGEMENLTYNPNERASGIIIESNMDHQRGIMAAAILKNGTLKTGDQIATESAFGKIKILENFLGKKVISLSPSAPALILGFETMPKIGEEFFSGEINLTEIQINKQKNPEKLKNLKSQPNQKYINLILKADTTGSLDALKNVLLDTSMKIDQLKFIQESVGEITDNDVRSATASNAIIIGFKTKTQKSAEEMAKIHSVKIISSEIIYELRKVLEESLSSQKNQKISGELEVLAVFNQKTKKQIIGGKVISGIIKKNTKVKIIRDNKEMELGRIINLQFGKQDAAEVESGNECGLLFESDIKINVSDHLIHEA